MSFLQDILKARRQLYILNENIIRSLPDCADAGAEVLLEEVNLRTPERTGKLKRGNGKRAGARTLGKAEAVVFNTVFYSRFVEYGTRKMRKRPFFRPAADAKRQQIARAMERVVKDKDGI